MKKNKLQFLMRSLLFTGMISLITMVSCKKDTDEPDPETKAPIASFQFAISETNFMEVTFTNFSQNATSYSWNFGDGQNSTEVNPTHMYDAPGNYDVVLTANNDANQSANFSQTIEINDPDEALALLAGSTSKTWKLYREGTSIGVGPDADSPRIWWSLSNTGERPCLYYQEFTFNRDGSFVFDDKGSFWGESDVFPEDLVETCFEAIPANMVNVEGTDVSAWLSGTHAFEYEPATNTVTLTGLGVWIGLVKLASTESVIEPQNSVSFKISIEQDVGYDLMIISFTYDGLYWDATYASYSNPALEPEVVTEAPPWGEDLPDLTPTEMYNTFASVDEAVLLIPTESAVTINIGVDDPAGGAANVGEYVRGTELFADLKFQTEYDIQFDNFTTVSIDVYIPSSNIYEEGGLTKSILIWIADASQTQEFWTNWVEFLVNPDDVVTDEWKTYTFQLDSPTGGVGTPIDRQDLDLFGLTIGGAGHAIDGTFYIRNFSFD